MVLKESWWQEIPQIDWDIVSYRWQEYKLIRMSKEAVVKTGTPLNIADKGLLSIEGSKIWMYKIPEEYLSYAIINEIECPDVRDWEGLCLESLKIELATVRQEMMDEYLVWRISFFKNMEDFWTSVEDDKFYAWEMRKSYMYLEDLQKQRKVWDETTGWVNNILGL